MSKALGYLLDTNVLSEPSKRHPNDSVLAFIDLTSPRLFHISVLTLGELRRGAKRKAPNNAELTLWINTIERRFATRTLPITKEIAQLWGELSASRSLLIIDTLLAATAIVHDLTLVTRNTKDFTNSGANLLNPWT